MTPLLISALAETAKSENDNKARTAKLEFDIGVFDSFSQLGPVRSQVITLNVSPSGYNDFMRKPFQFTLPIPMPAGQQTLRAAISGESCDGHESHRQNIAQNNRLPDGQFPVG